jgi:serine/threonine-protein kinase
VAASLPGGDPLAAALAAGETPSPEVVAEAGEVGRLSIRAAWIGGSALAVGFALVLLLSGRTQLARLVPLDKPPEVLADRARTILADLGYPDPPGDTMQGFSAEPRYLQHVVVHDRSMQRWTQLAAGRPPAIRYWYRQSPDVLLSYDRAAPSPTFYDPPTIEPGMITMFLDTRGRLEELQIVPPGRDEGSATAPEPDWSPLLEAAGLDAASMRAVEPQWAPAVGSDRRAAWEGSAPGTPEIPIRVEAASYRGRAVSFRIVYPWTTPSGGKPEGTSLLLKLSAAMVTVVVVAIILSGIVFARRNIRLGRGDRKGALRLAAVVFSFGLASTFLEAHYAPSLTLVGRLVLLTEFPMLVAAVVWIFYLALEPYLRRIWPHMIVSWVRLLDGRFRDPLVGRDVFIGLLIGVGMRLLDQTYQLAAERLGLASTISDLIAGPPIEQSLIALRGWRQSLSNLSAFLVAALIFQLAFLVLLLLCRLLLRRQGPAIAMFFVLSLVTGIPAGVDPRGVLVWGALSTAVLLLTYLRFGLLTAVAMGFAGVLLVSFPLTWNASTWYSGRTLLVALVLGAMAAYSLRVSVVRGSTA